MGLRHVGEDEHRLMTSFSQDATSSSEDLPLLRQIVAHLRLLVRHERKILSILLLYAAAVGFLSLIVPLTVQELITTFAFAVQPIMLLTLATIMVCILLFVGVFRVLQFFAMDILERRIFVRVTLALAQQLPRFQERFFNTEQASRFFETVLMQRALSSLLIDLTNVFVGGVIGMTVLVFYHPSFLAFNVLLVVAGAAVVWLGHGGLSATLHMSEAKYDTFHWVQEVANNLLHFKATSSAPLILRKADALAGAYVAARQSRFRILVRQYIGSVVFQAVAHAGMLGTAGWLLAIDELTLGQFVAAEVIVATLLLSFNSVTKRMYVVFYFFTSLVELGRLFTLPQDVVPRRPIPLDLQGPRAQGLALACEHASLALDSSEIFHDVTVEAPPGKKMAIICESEIGRHLLARKLAGLDSPVTGIVRYNGIDVHDLDSETINAARGLILGWRLSLFEGTLEENLTMGRAGITAEDLQWALQFVEMEDEIASLPLGLSTTVGQGAKELPPSQRLRLLIARAIVIRPPLLILDGVLALHEIQPAIREALLDRLCSKEQPWSLIIVTTSPTIKAYVEDCLPAS